MAKKHGTQPHVMLEGEKQRTRIAELYATGMPQYKIAEEIGIHFSNVSRAIGKIRAELRDSRLQDMSDVTEEQLQKIDDAEQEAWKAWRRSCERALEIKTSEETLPEKKKTEHKTIKNQAGDARFLDIVLKCVERRCRLLGLDVNPSDAGNSAAVDLAVIEVVIKSRDEAMEIMDMDKFRKALAPSEN